MQEKQLAVINCHICVCIFQTKYILSYDVVSGEDKKMYKVGKICSLEVKVKATELAARGQTLVYEVCTQQTWAVSGKSTGNQTDIILFQPVLHNWCNKGCGMCYPVWDGAYKRTHAVNR